MRHITFLTIVFILASCVKEDSLIINLEQEMFTPQHYIVAKTPTPLVIDGLANDPAWGNAPFTNYFIDIEGQKTPKYKTQIKMLWDDKFLYVLAHLEEPHIWGNLRQRDTVIFYNNDFEVFLDPSGTTYNYGEIEVNALNTVWDLTLDKPYRVGGNADNSWNLDELKTAVSHQGTLNNPNDIDNSWMVEFAIPLKPIMKLKGSGSNGPENAEQWRVNFSRVQWQHDLTNNAYSRKKVDGKFLPEYNWVWSNQGVINMHEPEKWGYIQFSDKENIEQEQFIPDADLKMKQAAYAMFRLVQFKDLKYLQEEETGFTQEIHATTANNEIVKTTFVKTTDGYTISMKEAKGNKIFTINQAGWLEID